MAVIFFVIVYILNLHNLPNDHVQLANYLPCFENQLVNIMLLFAFVVFSFLCGFNITKMGYIALKEKKINFNKTLILAKKSLSFTER